MIHGSKVVIGTSLLYRQIQSLINVACGVCRYTHACVYASILSMNTFLQKVLVYIMVNFKVGLV